MPDALGYVIAEVEVTDPTGYQTYVDKVMPTLAAHNGKLIVLGKASAKEGPIPVGNIVVLEFPSLAVAEGWYRSAEYAEAIPLRQRAANSRLFIVQGMPGTGQ